MLALLAIISYFFCFDAFLQYNRNYNIGAKGDLSIMTFNTKNFGLINGVIKNQGFSKVVDFINDKDADIVVIQEFWNKGMRPFKNYPYYFVGYRKHVKKSIQIIFSKYPIIKKGYIDFKDTNNNAMFADIAYKGEVIRIYNLHLESYRTDVFRPLKNTKAYTPLVKRIRVAEKVRKEQALQVRNHMDDFKGKRIVCGDLNATQFSSTYSLVKGANKDSFIEAGNGFGTTFNLYHYPLRLDYIFVDNNFEIMLHENFNLNISDHEPVFSRLHLK